jgi:hypothetical protein
MALPIVVRGALIGGGVGAVLAALRSPAEGQEEPGRFGRVVKSAAEGAIAGAAVGFVLDRQLRRRAAELLAANAPVVVDAATELARRYEPAVEHFVEVARERAVDAYEAARPLVLEAYETARPRVEDAVETVRLRAMELRSA